MSDILNGQAPKREPDDSPELRAAIEAGLAIIAARVEHDMVMCEVGWAS